ncbi:hypothetical protein IV203_032235 [Nitzschia inconspicua]|uniref:DUF6824 domain-containing protein n=1 Tax=Nitzschia inconspicua TaxID=303405 RepID=A0A9K3KJ63_9STRA|nr:hypothetical protein IV203_032235 [Nitzschia inconspicua]
MQVEDIGNTINQHEDTDATVIRKLGAAERIRIQEMSQLSHYDRQRIQEEIHGVCSMAVQETPEVVVAALEQFDHYLAAATAAQTMENTAYFVARSHGLSCHYVLTNRDFHLKFLRADFFHAPRSVQRYLKNIAILYKYFGLVALQRPIRFSDLNKEEQLEIKSGHLLQILPSRDRAGRLILVMLGGPATMTKVPVRSTLYIVNTASQDVATQRLGAVLIWAGCVTMAVKFRRVHESLQEMWPADPIRYSAMHMCLPPGPLFNVLRAAIFFNVMATDRIRAIVHGELSSIECQYSLMCFGIPADQLPVTNSGKVKTKPNLRLLKALQFIDSCSADNTGSVGFPFQQQQQQQPHQQQFDGILFPNVKDVLFSRGGSAKRHFGNIEFQGLLESAFIKYNTMGSPTYQRVQLACSEVLDVILSSGGRLLTLHRDGAWWVEIVDPVERQSRIKAAWYDHIRRTNAQRQQQDTSSDTMQFVDLTPSSSSAAACTTSETRGGCCSPNQTKD